MIKYLPGNNFLFHLEYLEFPTTTTPAANKRVLDSKYVEMKEEKSTVKASCRMVLQTAHFLPNTDSAMMSKFYSPRTLLPYSTYNIS